MPLLNRSAHGGISPIVYNEDGVYKRIDVIHGTIVFLAAFLIYFWSAPRTVGLEDDGYFILAAYYNGIAQPPGYPFYTLLAHAATLIPIGSVALRVHLLSGILGALACACIWFISRILIQDRTAAYAAALSLAYSKVFWSQAIIAKGVYTLNAFLLFAAFLCVLIAHKRRPGEAYGREIQILFLCYGLALSNHLPLVVLSTPMLIAALWHDRKKFSQFVLKGLPFLLLGLTPYLWMIIRSQMNPEIFFMGPIETISDFWHYLSRRPYAEIEHSPSADWFDKLQYLKYVLFQTGEQYGLFGWFFVLTGVIFQWRRLPAYLCTALIIGYLGSTLVLIILLGFDYEEYHKALFSVYPVISYAIGALWLGIGLASTANVLMQKLLPHASPGMIPAAIAALIIISTLVNNVAWNYRHDDDWARQYAVTILDSLPQGAILFTDGMGDGAIAYMNKIERYRPDIDLYSARSVLFKNRLYHPLQATSVQVAKAKDEFIKSQARPVYVISGLFSNYAYEYYGLYYGVSKNAEQSTHIAIVQPRFLSYWNFILGQRARHPWENIHRTSLLDSGCNLLIMAEDAPVQNRTDYAQIKKIRNRLCDNLRGDYIMLEAMIHKDQPDWDKIKVLLEKAATQLDEALLKSDISKLDYYRGIMYLKTGDREKGRYFLEQSLLRWNHPLNKAGDELKK